MAELQPIFDKRDPLELRPYVTEAPSALTPEAEFGGGLHGGKAAMNKPYGGTDIRIEEQPWHLHAARYLAIGIAKSEVAKACGVSANTISQLISNQWFKQRIVEFMKDSNKGVSDLVNAAALGAFKVMVDIMEDPKVSASVRSQTAKSFLEWHLGKPTQKTEVTHKDAVSNEPVKELEELKKREVSLVKQLSN